MAMYLEMNEELGIPQPSMIAFADYEDEADRTGKLFQAMIDDAMENDGLKWNEIEVRGRTVLVFDVPAQTADPMEEDFGQPIPDPMAMVGDIEKLYYVQEDDTFLMASALEGIEHALQTIDDGDEEGISANEDFRAIRDQVGTTHDAWGALLIGDLAEMMGGPAAGMPLPIDVEAITKLLVGNMRGFGFGIDVDGESGMVESTIAAYIPDGKTGVPALFDTAAPRGDLPGFVGPDTMSYSRMNVDFPEIMELVRTLVRNLPAEGREQFDMMLEQLGPMIEQGLNNLGPDTHVVTTLTRPIDFDSRRTVFAISAPKPDAVRPLLSMLAMNFGLMPRDFLGHSIWSAEDAFMPVAFGLGGGHVFVGTNEDVEQALRAVGDTGRASLDDEHSFRHVHSSLGNGNVVGWGYIDTIADFEFERAVALADLRGLLEDPMLADELAADLLEGVSLDDVQTRLREMTPELLRRYVGPSSWTVKSTDDGFVLKHMLLRPADAE